MSLKIIVQFCIILWCAKNHQMFENTNECTYGSTLFHSLSSFDGSCISSRDDRETTSTTSVLVKREHLLWLLILFEEVEPCCFALDSGWECVEVAWCVGATALDEAFFHWDSRLLASTSPAFTFRNPFGNEVILVIVNIYWGLWSTPLLLCFQQ